MVLYQLSLANIFDVSLSSCSFDDFFNVLVDLFYCVRFFFFVVVVVQFFPLALPWVESRAS